MKLKYLYGLIVCLILLAISAGTYYGFTPAPYMPRGFTAPHEVNELPKLIAHQAKLSKNSAGNTIQDITAVLKSPIGGIQLDIILDSNDIPILKNAEHVTLEDALKTIGDQKYVFLSVNTGKFINGKLCSQIADLIEKFELSETVIVESLDPWILRQYRSIAPYNLIMYDFLPNTVNSEKNHFKQPPYGNWILRQSIVQEWIKWNLNPDLLGPEASFTEGKLRGMQNLGYPLIVWPVDQTRKARELFKLGVTGIQTTNAENLLPTVPVTETILDASGLELAKNVQVIPINTIADIQNALQLAQNTKRKVSAYGRRHSQGGQSFSDNNIVLNMKNYDAMHLLDDGTTLNVQAGATWEQVQKYLNTFGRAVKVMQSDNDFTIGSTASVNGYGWQVSSGPFASTVQSLKLALANGSILECSRQNNAEIFSAVLGGYGLLGIITELNIDTVPNYELSREHDVIPTKDFADRYAMEVTLNPKAELAYGRLDVDSSHLFYDVLLVVYSRDKELSVSTAPIDFQHQLNLKNKIFSIPERNDEGRQARWSLERNFYGLMPELAISRNNLMATDVQTLWPYSYQNTEVMQTYFIPLAKLNEFLPPLRDLVIQHELDLLVATATQVRSDDLTLLAYAKQDVFAISLIFSQAETAEANVQMQQFTQRAVARALELGGSFYLPFRPHYTKQQLEKAYPHLSEFMRLKKKYDPQELFVNNWYLRYLQK